MTSEELLKMLNQIQKAKCETQTLELKSYVQPLIDSGKIKLLIPDVPGSHKQKYYSAE